MKKFIKNYWIILVIILLLILPPIISTTRLAMINLPVGEYISSLDSPNGDYTLNSYRYSGHSTVDWSLRVEVVNNKTSKKFNIYCKYHEDEATMKWIDDENVEINGIKLNIHKDYYHK